MRRYAVIVAGGSGSRMGGGIPKQFRTLNGHPVLWWSIKAFHEQDPSTSIIVVLPADFISLWKDFYSSLPDEERFEHEIVAGGSNRTESVRNGIGLIPEEDALVAIHDGARPLLKSSLIAKGWKSVMATGAAIPVVEVTDTLRKLTKGSSESVDRKDYVRVQTPQVFKMSILRRAYNQTIEGAFTDDASLVEKMGEKVTLFKGDTANIKITNPEDMAMAAVLMSKDA